jgi:N-acetylmuramoyl-L-alanine amidase
MNRKPLLFVLDPGHGGSDPGAVGPRGLKESHVVLSVARMVKELLEHDGHKVVMTREEDKTINPPQRVLMCGENVVPDAFVSLHCNDFSDDKVSGFETLFGQEQKESRYLAGFIQNALMMRFPEHNNRGLKESPSPDYGKRVYVINNQKSGVPSCLVEMEFISNPTWEAWLRVDAAQIALAQAIHSGIEDWRISLGK